MQLEQTAQIIKRFWGHVDAQTAEGCWEWRGAKSSAGYGNFRIDKNRQIGSHRFIMWACTGTMPNLFVCHKCDNRGCVNPYMRRNSETCQGERHGHARLTNVQVLEIRARYRNGEKVTEIVKDYPVARRNLYYIVRGKGWKHLL